MLIGKDFHVLENGKLSFADYIIKPEPDIRYLEDASHVLYDKPDNAENRPLYYMYRGVSYAVHQELFRKAGLRYDLTVILPGKIGQEFIKTIGHFHPMKPTGHETYPEYYEVLNGEALYLLQKNSRSGEVEEVKVIAAKKGDRIFIPPGYGHVTINPGDQPLIMSNLIENSFQSLYEPFAEKHGAAYYYIQLESGKGDFIKNPHYASSISLQLLSAPNQPQPVEAVKEKSLYQAFVDNPASFNLLK